MSLLPLDHARPSTPAERAANVAISRVPVLRIRQALLPALAAFLLR